MQSLVWVVVVVVRGRTVLLLLLVGKVWVRQSRGLQQRRTSCSSGQLVSRGLWRACVVMNLWPGWMIAVGTSELHWAWARVGQVSQIHHASLGLCAGAAAAVSSS